MGITIYYRGRIEPLDQIEPCIAELENIAKTLKWEYFLCDGSKPKKEAGVPATGIGLHIHPKSEHFCICFDPDGILRHPIAADFGLLKDPVFGEDFFVFVKTHYAPVHNHIAVVWLLRYLKRRYIPNLEVSDEAGYWESDDLDALKEFWGEDENDESSGYPPDTMLSMLDNLLTV